MVQEAHPPSRQEFGAAGAAPAEPSADAAADPNAGAANTVQPTGRYCENEAVSARVVSVNVGKPVDVAWARPLRRTSIDKRPVDGPVQVTALGIEGDQVSDTKHHGGIDQAVYVFAREDLDIWGERVGQRIRNGQFGENLTTAGIDVNEALLGERWRVGAVLFEVAEVRIPCNTFKNWLGLTGIDNAGWLKRFTAEGRPGPYLRVLESGSLAAGDEVVVVHRPSHDITVSTMFRAFTTDRSLLPRLLEVGESLAAKPREAAEKAAAVAASGHNPAAPGSGTAAMPRPGAATPTTR